MKTRIWAVALGVAGCTGSGSDAGLVLDYTAFVQGAVQVSGLAVSPVDGTLAAVTDFEQVLLVDPATTDVIASYSVQLGELPEQGSTEAVSFTGAGEVAVLYPDDEVLRVYDPAGALLRELDPDPSGDMHGAMTIAHDDDVAWLALGEGPVEVVAVSLTDGSEVDRLELQGDVPTEIVGLSLPANGADEELWAVDAANRAYTFDLSSGRSVVQGTTGEVAEPSGAEAFVNEEGESVLAVSDDDDAYNAEPGPIRLFLL